MAHTVILTRGHLEYVEKFIKELSTRYMDYPNTNSLVQMRVCPIQLWDISYPEEYRDVIHTTLFGDNKGKPIHSSLSKYIYPMRKAMKLSKLPPYKTDSWLPMRKPEHMEVIAIGVKDDDWIEPDGKVVKKKDKSEKAREGI